MSDLLFNNHQNEVLFLVLIVFSYFKTLLSVDDIVYITLIKSACNKRTVIGR